MPTMRSLAIFGQKVEQLFIRVSLGEMRDAQLLAETFPGPRPGYKRSNAQIPRILEQL
jgi:hypothetical protein